MKSSVTIGIIPEDFICCWDAYSLAYLKESLTRAR
jgi:hypothetical protein